MDDVKTMKDEEKQTRNSKKAILLVSLGTLDSYGVNDAHKYLKEFFSDPRVIDAFALIWQLILLLLILPFRSPKTAKLYQKICGENFLSSPLNVVHTGSGA